APAGRAEPRLRDRLSRGQRSHARRIVGSGRGLSSVSRSRRGRTGPAARQEPLPKRPLRFRRPSPAMTVAVLALVVALGGSAYAVSRINGTSIRPRSIPADRVRRNALTGTEINEAKLGR